MSKASKSPTNIPETEMVVSEGKIALENIRGEHSLQGLEEGTTIISSDIESFASQGFRYDGAHENVVQEEHLRVAFLEKYRVTQAMEVEKVILCIPDLNKTPIDMSTNTVMLEQFDSFPSNPPPNKISGIQSQMLVIPNLSESPEENSSNTVICESSSSMSHFICQKQVFNTNNHGLIPIFGKKSGLDTEISLVTADERRKKNLNYLVCEYPPQNIDGMEVISEGERIDIKQLVKETTSTPTGKTKSCEKENKQVLKTVAPGSVAPQQVLSATNYVEPLLPPVIEKSDHQPKGNLGDVKFPRNAQSLFSTGILDGAPVFYYDYVNKVKHWALVKGEKYLCGCKKCRFVKLVAAIDFINHSGCSRKRQKHSKFITFKTGFSVEFVADYILRAPSRMMFKYLHMLTGSAINVQNFHNYTKKSGARRVKQVNDAEQ